ncbi:MAG: TetR/AcrR family transcriptional regulator [Bacteroidales bacterium]
MNEDSTNTEQIILKAARKVFTEKGREGARMQEIADEAGINKALLHYYFRSKDRLFQAVFFEVLDKFIPEVTNMAFTNKSVFEILKFFVERYIDLILENPHIPSFILHELSQNPDGIAKLLGSRTAGMSRFLEKIQQEMDAGIIRNGDPRQVMINTIGLCVFPFVAKPIVKHIYFDGDDAAYRQFLIERKTEVYQFIINSIKV